MTAMTMQAMTMQWLVIDKSVRDEDEGYNDDYDFNDS